MRELFDALLDRHPGIALRIHTAVSGSHLGELFRWIGAERRRGPHTEKGNQRYDPYSTQHPSSMAITAKRTRQHHVNWIDRLVRF
jgi:hypothetical protein